MIDSCILQGFFTWATLLSGSLLIYKKYRSRLIYLSTYPLICLSPMLLNFLLVIYLSIYMSIFQSPYLFISLFMYLSISQSCITFYLLLTSNVSTFISNSLSHYFKFELIYDYHNVEARTQHTDKTSNGSLPPDLLIRFLLRCSVIQVTADSFLFIVESSASPQIILS